MQNKNGRCQNIKAIYILLKCQRSSSLIFFNECGHRLFHLLGMTFSCSFLILLI